jgi:hypothetical protein
MAKKSKMKAKELFGNTPQIDHKDKRRFQRVYLDRVPEIIGVQVQWSSGENSQVFDLSYNGLALSRPEAFEPQVGQRLDLSLQFEGQTFEVVVEVMWFNDRVIGAGILSMSPEARLCVDDFLSEKLVGLHLSLVPSEIMNKNLGCSYWFSGPQDTNVLVWMSGQRFQKVQVEYDGYRIVWESGTWSIGFIGRGLGEEEEAQIEQKTSQEQNKKVLRKVLGMLSQMPDPPEVIIQIVARLRKDIHQGL